MFSGNNRITKYNDSVILESEYINSGLSYSFNRLRYDSTINDRMFTESFARLDKRKIIMLSEGVSPLDKELQLLNEFEVDEIGKSIKNLIIKIYNKLITILEGFRNAFTLLLNKDINPIIDKYKNAIMELHAAGKLDDIKWKEYKSPYFQGRVFPVKTNGAYIGGGSVDYIILNRESMNKVYDLMIKEIGSKDEFESESTTKLSNIAISKIIPFNFNGNYDNINKTIEIFYFGADPNYSDINENILNNILDKETYNGVIDKINEYKEKIIKFREESLKDENISKKLVDVISNANTKIINMDLYLTKKRINECIKVLLKCKSRLRIKDIDENGYIYNKYNSKIIEKNNEYICECVVNKYFEGIYY